LDNKTIRELAIKIHQQNVDMGWWDNPRSIPVFVDLFHSELSEAMEGLRKNLMDDHLPQHPMFLVEVADFVIRVLDTLGANQYFLNIHFSDDVTDAPEFEGDDLELLALLHWCVSKYYETTTMQFLANAVQLAFMHVEKQGVDLLGIINEKSEYNLHREDHKKENRETEHGKKF